MNTPLNAAELAAGAVRLGLRAAGGLLALNDRIIGRALLVAVLAGGFAGASWFLGVAVDIFGFHPERNAAAWAARPVSFASDALCGDCHEPAVAALVDAPHANVPCQACHGPLEAHAVTEPPPAVEAATRSEVEATCVTCHSADIARPVTLAQVGLEDHYVAGFCADCHDPHATTGIRPPEVRHPLARLPECLTCHAELSFRPATAGHRPAPDDQCLSCHLGELPDRLSGSLP